MPPEQSLLPNDPPAQEPTPEVTQPEIVTPPAQESQRFENQQDPEPPQVQDPAPVELTDELREKVRLEMREGVPEKPEDYKLPDALFEGKDETEKASLAAEIDKSPLMQMVRTAAHEAGMKPEAFQKFVADYFEAEQKVSDEAYQAEKAQLGADEAAITKRVGDLAGAIQRTLPADEAAAVIALTTSAAAVRGLEKLINRTGPAPSTPAPTLDDWPTIESLMNSTKYMGPNPDPQTVARVDRFFQNGGKRPRPQ